MRKLDVVNNRREITSIKRRDSSKQKSVNHMMKNRVIGKEEVLPKSLVLFGKL